MLMVMKQGSKIAKVLSIRLDPHCESHCIKKNGTLAQVKHSCSSYHFRKIYAWNILLLDFFLVFFLMVYLLRFYK